MMFGFFAYIWHKVDTQKLYYPLLFPCLLLVIYFWLYNDMYDVYLNFTVGFLKMSIGHRGRSRYHQWMTISWFTITCDIKSGASFLLLTAESIIIPKLRLSGINMLSQPLQKQTYCCKCYLIISCSLLLIEYPERMIHKSWLQFRCTEKLDC